MAHLKNVSFLGKEVKSAVYGGRFTNNPGFSQDYPQKLCTASGCGLEGCPLNLNFLFHSSKLKNIRNSLQHICSTLQAVV